MSFGSIMINPFRPKSKIAVLYYLMFGVPFLNMHLRWRAIKGVVKQLKSPILDVGCGNGAFSFEAARVSRGYVIGFDIKREDVLFAKRVARKKKIENVDFLVADGRQMPFRKAAFASIMCLEVLEHVVEDDLLLAESSRVLKRRGLFVATSVLPRYTLYSLLPIFSQNIHDKEFFKEMDHVRDGYCLDSLKDALSNVGLKTIKHGDFVRFFGAIGVKFVDFLLHYRAPLGALSEHVRILVFPFFLLLSRLDAFVPFKGKELMLLAIAET